ncbi:uncharacterized protein [Drosophila kikkawai]|uniref:PPIase cyclophilin-type domain-containing protein n=1 Tax=Drosophila kikkawai TaxID=30033 RepID=A0A6P4IZH3_DROKI|nr:uncharacterized protein LOC108078825 [Drosophila kikkawai]
MRLVAYSEFYANHQSSRKAKMQARKVASDLLTDKLVREKLPRNRAPTYSEFRQIMRSAGKRTMADSNLLTFRSMVELRKAQIERGRLKSIKSSVDSRLNRDPTFFNRSKLVDELNHKQNLFRKNLQLLGKLTEINRVKYTVDCFNRKYPALQPNRIRIRDLTERLNQENRQLGCRLSAVKSKVDSQNPLAGPPKPLEQKASDETVSEFIPYMPSPRLGKRSAHVLLRPIVYFDLAVLENSQILGRLLLQLYTEISPEVVLEFVRMATHNDVQSHRFVRIFSNLWMEGELMLENRGTLSEHHSVKRSFLDPGKLTGLLSYSWDYRRNFPQGLLSYTISFKPLSVDPLQRVIFGQVRSGLRVLQSCPQFGTRNGKTKKTVIVARCGLL